MNVPTGYALVGSSNFTKAGLTQNIELNVQVRDDVAELQKWFETQWKIGVEVSDALLKAIDARCREFAPYDVYLRSMYEYFKTKGKSISEWEKDESSVFNSLSQYQKDGYYNLISIAGKYKGAFLCDGVGLGKTYVGMMLIERLVKKERRNVVLIVPAAARESVWENTIKKVMPEILGGFYPFKIINHTDLCLPKNELLIKQIAEQGEVLIIDEAHHFRNRASNRYKKLFDIIGQGHEKQVFMLTATPINNSFLDLQHLIELFTQRQEDFFAIPPLGINSLTGHFRKMESRLEQSHGDASQLDIPGLLQDDAATGDQLVRELVVQRSRAYVKQSLSLTESSRVVFSNRQPPSVVNYSLVQEWKDKIGGGTTQATTQTTAQTTQTATQTTAQTGIHRSFELTDAQTRIVEYLREHPSASRREIVENSGVTISEDGVKYNLARLQDLHRIKRVGPDYGGHWEVCD